MTEVSELHPDQCPVCKTSPYPKRSVCGCGYRGGDGPTGKMRFTKSIPVMILGGLCVGAGLVVLGLLFP